MWFIIVNTVVLTIYYVIGYHYEKKRKRDIYG
jgi:hypothetical protein